MVWIDDFFRFRSDNQLPVDVVSTHPFPQDFAIDEPGALCASIFAAADSTLDDLRTLRRLVAASPHPNSEIQLTEWDSSPSPTDHAALFYNYPSELNVSLPVARTLEEADAGDAKGGAHSLAVHIEHLPARAKFTIEILDRGHGNAIFAWEQIGRPEPPNREQVKSLQAAATIPSRRTCRRTVTGHSTSRGRSSPGD